MTDQRARECVARFLDAYYGGDAAAALDCCAENVESITYAPVELFPHLGQQRGKSWLAEMIALQQRRYSRRRYQLSFIAVDGDKVATMQSVQLEKRSDRRVVDLTVAQFFTLRGGRIAAHRSFFDSFDFVQQLLGRDLTESFAATVSAAMES